jgi:hypothetical protein
MKGGRDGGKYEDAKHGNSLVDEVARRRRGSADGEVHAGGYSYS